MPEKHRKALERWTRDAAEKHRMALERWLQSAVYTALPGSLDVDRALQIATGKVGRG